MHQTFEGDGFVICSFCPRPYDFDPTAVPAPYNHSNVMSDEVLYYANSEFMSRKGIEYGSVTCIPTASRMARIRDVPRIRSGKDAHNELAVMVDTFRPLAGRQAGSRRGGQGILPVVAGALRSWVRSANEPDCGFPLENLPYCRFNGGKQGVVIGDSVLEIAEYDRDALTRLLREDSTETAARYIRYRRCDVRTAVEIRNYTDFYASIHHATNVGKKFRPDNPLLPNYDMCRSRITGGRRPS